MTKIPSVEERVEEFSIVNDYPVDIGGWILTYTHQLTEKQKNWLTQTLTADRTALLTELRESGLLEEKDVSGEFLCDLVYRMPPQDGDTVTHTHVDYSARKGHNTLARAVKELISNMDKV